MKKWLVALVVLLLLLVGYVAAGPFLAVNAIRRAAQEQDAAAVARHVDFPALRMSFRQQLDGYMARRAGPDVQSGMFGSLALGAASGATGLLVDALATPAGLAAVMEGRGVLRRFQGPRHDGGAATPPQDYLDNARYRFESPSRFTVTVDHGDGRPVVLVLTRRDLRWKVSDIRLPLENG